MRTLLIVISVIVGLPAVLQIVRGYRHRHDARPNVDLWIFRRYDGQ